MDVNIPEYVSLIMHIMDNAEMQPFLVGGCVRDFIMGVTPHDYDITVNSTPEIIAKTFENKGYKTVLKGRQYGTVGVLAEKELIEITPYRTESDYRDSRHPNNIEFVGDIKLDLARRDFTINAMAMDSSGNIIDIFGGKNDLQNGIIRCVGKAEVRFSEDALRILRALRFAARFNFKVDVETKIAMTKCKNLLNNISAERIQSEFYNTLCFPGAYNVLTECSDIMQAIIPFFTANEFLKKNYGDFALKLFSCIYTANADEVYKCCRFLKLSNNDMNRIVKLHKLYNKFGARIVFGKEIKKALCNEKAENIKDLFVFCNADTDELDYYLKNGVYQLSSLALCGGDIMELGIFPKQTISKLLQKALYSVAVGDIPNRRADIIDFLIKNGV